MLYIVYTNVYTISMSKKYLLYIHHPNFQQEKRKSDLVNKLLDDHYNGTVENKQTALTDNVYTRPLDSPSARRVGDVLKEIEAKKRELNELLEVSQDPHDYVSLQNQIQALWDEYHLLKAQDD